MDDELRITVPGASGLPEETREALQDALARRGRYLLEEAGRLEAEVNSGMGPPMITPALIGHADSWQRANYVNRRISKKTRTYALVGAIGVFVGGFFTNNLIEPWGAIGFVVCALVALVCFSKGAIQ